MFTAYSIILEESCYLLNNKWYKDKSWPVGSTGLVRSFDVMNM